MTETQAATQLLDTLQGARSILAPALEYAEQRKRPKCPRNWDEDGEITLDSRITQAIADARIALSSCAHAERYLDGAACFGED